MGVVAGLAAVAKLTAVQGEVEQLKTVITDLGRTTRSHSSTTPSTHAFHATARER
jgi:hypothetical protein